MLSSPSSSTLSPPPRSATHASGSHPSQNNSALPAAEVSPGATFVPELQITTGTPQDHEDGDKTRRGDGEKEEEGKEPPPQVPRGRPGRSKRRRLLWKLLGLPRRGAFRPVHPVSTPLLQRTHTGGILFSPESTHDDEQQLHLSAWEGGHERPPHYFFTVSLSLMSISLSDKGPRLHEHSYLNVPSKRLQET